MASSPLSPDLFCLGIEECTAPGDDKPFRYTLKYIPTKPVPEAFALVIGDVVHNCRAALDHLATAIARSEDPEAKIHYPMRREREAFVSPDKGLTNMLRPIEKAIPGATKLILDQVRPVDDAFDRFWAFHDLDNDDKHNLLIPTVTFASVTNVNARIGTHVISNCMFGDNAAEPMNIITSDGLPIAVENNFHVAVDIKFGDVGPFQNDPVIPTLAQIADMVARTIKVFERAIADRP
jgi:hypothetical protein